VQLATRDLPGIVESLRSDNGPPLYYFLLSGWVRAFGTGEAAARSLSGLFYALSVLGVYALGRCFHGRRTAFLCALLYMTCSARSRCARLRSPGPMSYWD